MTTAGTVVAAAIVRGSRVLAGERSYPASLAGQWEFPGGKVEAGESAADALVRECHEELGVVVEVGAVLGTDVTIAADGGSHRLRLFRCRIPADAVPQARSAAHRQVRWLGRHEFADVHWLVTNRQLLPRVVKILSTRA